MKSLWKNKTELHDMVRMQVLAHKPSPKPYVKDWSIPVRKNKNQGNQWSCVFSDEEEECISGHRRRNQKRASEWSRL